MPEIVYALTNEAMPDLVKIGRTTTSIEQRIRELDTTGLPLPFQCFHASEVNDSTVVERRLHAVFADRRVRRNREFFRVDPTQVKNAIQLAEIREVTPRGDVYSSPEDAEAVAAAENRRTKLKFSEIGVPVGATLTFAKDPSITCVVEGDGKVKFQEETMSSSTAALRASQSLGYQWSTIGGNDFWQYEGETLTARRLRLEDQET